jgi:2-dehydro-3-deoxyphosphogluconate aldolase/(4S)-4-hydroxy-2-oxoglutarate aldolase
MTNETILARIEEIGIIPAVRVPSAEDAMFASRAVLSGRIPVVEITMTVPGAVGVIASLRREHPDLIVGAGTVLNSDTARRAMDAGAMFLTTTGLDVEIVGFAVEEGIAIIPGALTPSEVMMAHKAGANVIKIFPCSVMGGASYIRALRSPFPHLKFVAAGGVNQQTASEFIRAGACAIGVGLDLLPKEAVRMRNLDWIHVLTKRFLGMVKEGRGLNAD